MVTLPDALEVQAHEMAERAASLAIERTAGFQFTTFQCATRVPDEMRGMHEAMIDAFRSRVRKAMRQRLQEAWPRRMPNNTRPEVIVEAQVEEDDGIKLRVAPVYVAGRYTKHARGISQTVFHCRQCRGREFGCEACNHSGRLVKQAVEDFVRPPIQEVLGGSGSAFHGAGREDVDVRMLGSGRPFVVSVQEPRRRELPDPAAIEQRVTELSGGRVQVTRITMTDRVAVKRLTKARAQKVYRVVARPAEGAQLPDDAEARLARLGGALLHQRTPMRVAGRRADKVRDRRVLEVVVESASPEEVVARLRTEAGTYVKELVSGDSGRTNPSFSGLLEVPCECAELDVLEIGDAEGGDPAGDAAGGPPDGG